MELALNPDLERDFQRITQATVGSKNCAACTRAQSWILVAGIFAFIVKLVIAYNTFGTNDVASFYMFARSLRDHGLEWTYQNGVVFFSNFPIFNHPPLVAYYLQLIESISRFEFLRDCGVTFPFLLRLPGIVADFVALLFVLKICEATSNLRVQVPALVLFAVSPVSIMVSGFHGNTDPIMVMFLVISTWMALTDRPIASGIFFALSCQIKIIPLLLFPILFFFWMHRNHVRSFTTAFALLTLAMWIQPIVKFPILFFRNVFAYNSYWGGWGISYWLRLTQWSQLSGTGPFHLASGAIIVCAALKCLIVAAVFVVAWRRRLLTNSALIGSYAYAWITFFIFSPGVSVQYLIWLAPFVLIFSPKFYAWLTVASAMFLFAFYNFTAGGLPWHLAVSRSNVAQINLWLPWSLWPWATLVFGTILVWKKAAAADSSLRLFSLKTLSAPNI